MTLVEGESQKLTATISPSNAENKVVIWTSSNSSVVSVKDGLVTAIKAGKATITVKSDDGGKTATCEVNVTSRSTGDENESVSETVIENIYLDMESLTMIPGTSYTFETEIVPVELSDKNLLWNSSDVKVATIDAFGKVTAVSEGTTSITAQAVGGVVASCSITVKSCVEATVEYVDEYGINHGKGVAIGGYVWTPVNCGYRAAYVENGTFYKGFPYGKLYQWGRKYGQGVGGDYDDGEVVIVEGPVSLDIGESKSYEECFFYNTEVPSNWLSTNDGTLWNSGTSTEAAKTDYDPCPAGWRVPTLDELSNLSWHRSAWTTNDSNMKGRYFSGIYDYIDGCPRLFLSASGFRYYDDGAMSSDDTYGHYWSSTPEYMGSRGLEFTYGNVSTYGYERRAYGFSIRCVQK